MKQKKFSKKIFLKKKEFKKKKKTHTQKKFWKKNLKKKQCNLKKRNSEIISDISLKKRKMQKKFKKNFFCVKKHPIF